MLLWLLSLAFANQCLVDYYNPPIELFSQYQCLEEDARSPASVGKLKPEVNKNLDGLNPNWTAQQRRVYRMLRNKSFNGADLNNDGTPDIQITKLQGGGQKITLSSGKDGKITQISVFDAYGKLVSERIDTDMDGQVDQVYECKNQSCERQYNIVNGKPQRLVRTIASGPDEIIEMFEDKNGKLELIKKTTRPALRIEFAIGDLGNAATEGGITTCGPECYDRNFKAFDAMLTKFEEAQKVKPPSLKKIDDFYVSRVGVLIHEECFEKYGDQIEKWVTDATVQGMTCQFDNYTIAKHFNQQSMSYESHIPRLMNLFSSSQQVNEGAVFDMNGKPNIMTNPCEDYKSLPLAKDMRVSPNCKYVPEVKLGAPKVICQSDQFALAVSIYDRSGHLANAGSNAYASGPHSKMPSYVNWKGKTKVYNYPVIGFVGSDRLLNEETFKAKFWHEIMHNCGYAHSDEGPDRAYFCEVACFGKAYGFNDSKIDGAQGQCEASDSNSSTFSQLEDIKRKIISLSPSMANQ